MICESERELEADTKVFELSATLTVSAESFIQLSIFNYSTSSHVFLIPYHFYS